MCKVALLLARCQHYYRHGLEPDFNIVCQFNKISSLLVEGLNSLGVCYFLINVLCHSIDYEFFMSRVPSYVCAWLDQSVVIIMAI